MRVTVSAAAAPAAGEHVASLDHVTGAAAVSLAPGVSRAVGRRPGGRHYGGHPAPGGGRGIGHDLACPCHEHGHSRGPCGHGDGERGAGGRGLGSGGGGGLVVLSGSGLRVQRGLCVGKTAGATVRRRKRC